MSDYAHRPSGPLKLKGTGDKDKKRKKKSSTSTDRTRVESAISQTEKQKEVAEQSSSSTSASAAAPATDGRKLTEAQRRFEEVQRQRREEKAKKNALLSHKDRVTEFNSKLDRLTEHHDMPKIGPG